MTLKQETKIGFTFGQIISLAALFITVFGYLISLNTTDATTISKVQELEKCQLKRSIFQSIPLAQKNL
jgi:hypothetical protein